MPVHHDETQQLLAETTRRFVEDRAPLGAVRARLDDEQGWDAKVWQAGAELGWPGLAVPEEHGGMADVGGPRLGDLVVVAHELGRVCYPGPFLGTVVVAAAVAAEGDDAQRADLLGALAAGERTAAWGFAADASLADPAAPELAVLERTGAGLHLRGVQRFVPEAARADVLLLSAHDGDGWTQVLVPADAEGVRIEALHGVDLSRRLADVVVDLVVEPAAVLGTPAGAGAAIERQVDLAAVLQAAETVGAAERLLEMTVEYARERIAFGRPIGSYQAIKHLLADLLLATEVAKAAVAVAVRTAAGPDAAAAHRAACTAAALVHEGCATVAEGCLQVHGGIGFTWEHDVHLYLRRARGNEALWGSPAWHRERLAVALGMDGDATAPVHDAEAPAAAEEEAPTLDAAEETWRREARAWIHANLPRRPEVLEAGPMTLEEELAHVEANRELQARLHAGGYGGITFPKAYGGAGLTLRHQQLFDAEAAEFERPLLWRVPTLSIIAPTIQAHATEEQKQRHLPRMIAGEELWVQLLSEPSGGSDLAGALTKATRDGDVFVVNGQKVWSTGAHYVDYGLCLVRTNPDVPKHRGLTMLIIPLRSPGVTSVPIRQINGQAEFCEVFFDDVVVPVENVVGAIDDGWTVASTMLVHERGAAGQTRKADVTADLIALARQRGKAADPLARQLVAQVHERAAVEPELVARLTAEMRAGEKPSTAGSLVKLFRATKAQFAGHAGLDIAGPHAAAWRPGDPGGERWSDDHLNSRARSIAGGTSEMQRNVISERVLGLPREAQPDRDVPFSQARSNTMPSRRGGAPAGS